MKRIGKYFLMGVMLICMFSYMGVVNAATIKALDTNKDSVKVLLTGKELSASDATNIESLLGTYSMFYKYEKIDDSVYNSYKSGDSSASSTINKLISDPQSSDELTEDNGWTKISSTQVTYEDLEAEAGYIVCLFAYSGSDTSTLLYYKNVYQATTSSELALTSSIIASSEEGDEVVKKKTVEKEPADEEETTDESEESSDLEEKSESNPETGISDVAMIIVPASLIAGTTLMIRRRFV